MNREGAEQVEREGFARLEAAVPEASLHALLTALDGLDWYERW